LNWRSTLSRVGGNNCREAAEDWGRRRGRKDNGENADAFWPTSSTDGPPDDESIVEQIARIEGYQVLLVTFRAAGERWLKVPIRAATMCGSD